MSAPDLETIFNVEDAVEAAAKAVLSDLGVPAFMQRETDDLPRDRVDLQLILGAHTGHRAQMNPGQQPGQFVRASWNGMLIFNICTRRFENDGNGKPQPVARDRHGKLRGKLRIAVEYFAARFTAELLPYHVLNSIKAASTDPTINVDDDLDVSAMQFEVVVSVRNSAWPAVG